MNMNMNIANRSILNEHGSIYNNLNVIYGSDKYDHTSNWVIDNLIPSLSCGILVGNTGAYKTFVSIEVACRIATGSEFGSEKTEKGSVVLVSGEGGSIQIARRIRAWEVTNKIDVGEQLLRIDQALNPLDPDDYQALVNIIDERKSITGEKAQLIIFDTLSQCASGLDENSAGSMSLYLKACNALTVATGASVLLVHHNSKTGGYRGSGALECNVDFMLTLKKSQEAMSSKLAIQKMKDGGTDLSYQFEMGQVDLKKTDQFGDQLTSLAIVSMTKTSDCKTKVLPLKVIDLDKVIIMKIMNDKHNGQLSYKETRGEFINILFKEQNVIESTAGNRFSRALKILEKDKSIEKKGDVIILSSYKLNDPVQLVLPF
jgi:putative DNA primase/helicase